VMAYNIGIEVFPRNVIAGMFNFKEEQLYQIPGAEKEAPKVSFAKP